MRLKVSSAKRRPSCLGLNVLTPLGRVTITICLFVSCGRFRVSPKHRLIYKWTKIKFDRCRRSLVVVEPVKYELDLTVLTNTFTETSLQWKLRNGVLTHWGRDKIATISQTTFSNAFSWMKMFEYRPRWHHAAQMPVSTTLVCEIIEKRLKYIRNT